MTTLADRVKAVLPTIVELRHAIHRYPELAYEEVKTSEKVCEHLQELPGISISKNVAETGVVAVLGNELEGPCIALRADMDALPIHEETDKSYRSTRPGLMHACGHDGHTACLVGAALILAQIQDQLVGPVKFVFQPAEEGRGGGKRMVDAGVLERPKVDAMFGLHGWPSLPLGSFHCIPGPVMAASSRFQMQIKGKGGHAARPHLCRNPVMAVAQIVQSLQSIAAQSVHPLEGVVVNPTMVSAGSNYNVVPEEAVIQGTIRSFTAEVHALAVRRVEEIAQACADLHEVEISTEIHHITPVVLNDKQAAAYFSKTSAKVMQVLSGEQEGGFPTASSEDFAFYLEQVPGAFCAIGVIPKGADSYPGLHTPTYDFPDEALEYGVGIFCEAALNFADFARS